jgi:hypothetical protein
MGRTVRLCLFTVTSATDGILFRDGPTAGTDAVRYVQFSHRVEISGGARLAASSRSLATPLVHLAHVELAPISNAVLNDATFETY